MSVIQDINRLLYVSHGLESIYPAFILIQFGVAGFFTEHQIEVTMDSLVVVDDENSRRLAVIRIEIGSGSWHK
ncbi:MAG TPA: hypothetical protein VNX46_05585 [Candidatus Acidoferrum sp.]|nr:hypothetical protein [Candidatus Acidoferrum sp.]